MMNALLGAGNLEEAEKWALNAIHNHPSRADVAVKLAEIYYRAGRKKAFLAVVQNLTSKDLEVPAEACSELVRMAGELALEETTLSKIQERNRADAPIAFH